MRHPYDSNAARAARVAAVRTRQCRARVRAPGPPAARCLRSRVDAAGCARRRAVLDGEQNRARPFAAECESLHDPQQQQQQGCEYADLRGGGQQPHQSGGTAHQEHRQRERLLPADAITDMAEDEAADGPDDEADGEGGERQQRSHQRALIGEEGVVEDQAGRGRVQEEVVPLDGGADEAGQQCRADRRIESGVTGPFDLMRGEFGRRRHADKPSPYRRAPNRFQRAMIATTCRTRALLFEQTFEGGPGVVAAVDPSRQPKSNWLHRRPKRPRPEPDAA